LVRPYYFVLSRRQGAPEPAPANGVTGEQHRLHPAADPGGVSIAKVGRSEVGGLAVKLSISESI
jgi:hypothetical protein